MIGRTIPLSRIVLEILVFLFRWSRLGYPQREYAAFLMDNNRFAEAIAQLKESIESFGNAIGHADARYSAEAHYHRSKAYWRLWKLTRDADHFRSAESDAKAAS